MVHKFVDFDEEYINQMLKRLLIIGNGMAAGRLLDELINGGILDTYRITVVGDEAQPNYNRIMLSPVLAKDVEKQSIIQKDFDWFESHGVELVTGLLAESIDRYNCRVHFNDGSSLNYDHLVIATGSRPFVIPAKNQDLKNIYSFRTLDDVESLSALATPKAKAIVIGGGLLGLEAAYGLAKQGVAVDLVHRGAWLLNRQLDEQAAAYLQHFMEEKGIRFLMDTEIVAFSGEESVQSGTLITGEQLDCDFVVIAAGIIPNKELGESCGLDCGRGICVDDYMTSSDKKISAIGECIQHKGLTFGLVEPIWQMCQSLAAKLCGGEEKAFENRPVATKLKVSGVDLFSAGEVMTQENHREFVIADDKSKYYRKILIDDNRVVGAVLFGDTRGGQDYFDFITKHINVSGVLPNLIFGSAHYDVEALNESLLTTYS